MEAWLTKKELAAELRVSVRTVERLHLLARHAIDRHVDQHQLRVLRVVEAEERRTMEQLAATLNGEGET